jgi:hypothetical protein
MKYILYYPARIILGLFYTACIIVSVVLIGTINFLWNFKFNWFKEIDWSFEVENANVYRPDIYPTVWHWVFKPMKK